MNARETRFQGKHRVGYIRYHRRFLFPAISPLNRVSIVDERAIVLRSIYIYNIFLFFTRATGLKLNIHAFNFDFLPSPLFLSFSFIFPFVSRVKRDSDEFFTRMNEHRGHVIKKRTCVFYFFIFFCSLAAGYI